jgi:hypothetical protein
MPRTKRIAPNVQTNELQLYVEVVDEYAIGRVRVTDHPHLITERTPPQSSQSSSYTKKALGMHGLRETDRTVVRDSSTNPPRSSRCAGRSIS